MGSAFDDPIDGERVMRSRGEVLGGFVVEVFKESVSGSDIDCRRCGSGEMVLPAGVGEGILLEEGL